jgi:hypothetical protein
VGDGNDASIQISARAMALRSLAWTRGRGGCDGLKRATMAEEGDAGKELQWR